MLYCQHMADTPAVPHGDLRTEWKFPEFVPHARSRAWYLMFMLAVAAFGALAVWQANYTFLMIIVLATVIYVIRLRMQPPLVTFSIREEGIEISGRFYAWEEFKEYWILYKPPTVKKLYLEFKGTFRPALDISLENQNPLKIRQTLNEYLLENTSREEEPVSDQWSRMLKL